MAKRSPEANPKQQAAVTAEALLDVIRRLVEEDDTRAQAGRELSLDSHLERDLGLDSLARTELVSRLGRTFAQALPDEVLLAETPRALLALLRQTADVPAREPSREKINLAAGDSAFPQGATTLMEALLWHLDRHPERTHILYESDAETPTEISYRTLWQGATRVAAGLWQYAVRAGDRVALMLPTGSGYFFSFFGILLAGAIPVPIYPPSRPSQLEEHLRRHGRILQNAGVRLLITVPEARGVARLLRTQVESLQHIVDWAALDSAPGSPPNILRQGEDIAFLQYTSGSTGDPKGVVLSHTHLLANIRAMGEAVAVSADDVFVSWLPLYHDMGLIGAWFGSLYFGMPLVVMSPLRFLARPARWLWAIHRHRGTLSASPNFGYELCLGKIPDEELAGLDLSSWRCAFNGAEPVSAATLRRFAARFAPYGFRDKALAPVYGLAEAAVGLAFPPPGRGPLVDRLQREPLMLGGEALPAARDDPDALEIVSCGRPLPGYRVQVVDAAGRALPERREGRLEFRGPSATGGYFNHPQATARLFRDHWLDTGDRAYLADGEIYITGRIKEMIIRGGRNIYPYEVEQAVAAIPGIRKGCVAVFADDDPDTGSERLVVVAESRERSAEQRDALRRAIRERVIDLLGLPPDDVLVTPPHRVLKTSSGKLRRSAMRTLYAEGHLARGERPLPLQVSRLLLSGIGLRLRRLRQNTTRYLFAAYAWVLFWALVPQVWLSVVALPRPAWRWAVIRTAIRILRRLTATPLRVEGLEKLPPPGQPYILVANHASYLDPLVLIDALPGEFAYVAKRELRQKFFARVFLQRLHTLFVERFDIRRIASSAGVFSAELQDGRSLVFFPEGTFRAEPGLLPFRMGAFVAAARSGAALVPVTIRGTRGILCDDTRLPRHGVVRVIIESPLAPRGQDWAEAKRLQASARTAIARHLDERDLGES